MEEDRDLSTIITVIEEARDLDTIIISMKNAQKKARILITTAKIKDTGNTSNATKGNNNNEVKYRADITRAPKLAKLDVINNALPNPHEKALKLINTANAMEQNGKKKAKDPTNALMDQMEEKKKAPDHATIGTPGEPSKLM